MPIHEYRCEKCGRVFEVTTLNMKDVKNRANCPLCLKNNEFGVGEKIISAGSFQIHGYNANNGYAGHMR